MQNNEHMPQQNDTGEPKAASRAVEETAPLPEYTPPIPPKKKRPRKVIVAVILTVLVLAGVGGYLRYEYLVPSQEAPNASVGQAPKVSPQVTPEAPKTPDVATIVTSIHKKLSGTPAPKVESVAVSHKAPGGYWTQIDDDKERIKHIVLQYSSRKANIAEFDVIKKELVTRGLEKVVDTGEPTDETANYQGHFASADVSCSLSNGGSGDWDEVTERVKYNSYVLTLGCAKISDFEQSIAAVKPFADVIKRASAEPSNTDLVLREPRVEKSPVDGYAYARVNVGGILAYVGSYRALLYQTPDKAWHYFIGTQNDLNCSDFKTVDIKRAFAGYTCYEGETRTKVVAS